MVVEVVVLVVECCEVNGGEVLGREEREGQREGDGTETRGGEERV